LLKIYHNPRCRKSREALKLLKKENLDFEVILYLENPLNFDDLKKILVKINLNPSAILRKNEKEWKTLPNRDSLSEDEILLALVSFPKLIERPIVVSNDNGVLARPIENLKEFLKSD
tara:strand:+ start:60 stop:410 length:351 start_codon:yes stop_codon:yes gene_type:complete